MFNIQEMLNKCLLLAGFLISIIYNIPEHEKLSDSFSHIYS